MFTDLQAATHSGELRSRSDGPRCMVGAYGIKLGGLMRGEALVGVGVKCELIFDAMQFMVALCWVWNNEKSIVAEKRMSVNACMRCRCVCHCCCST